MSRKWLSDLFKTFSPGLRPLPTPPRAAAGFICPTRFGAAMFGGAPQSLLEHYADDRVRSAGALIREKRS